MRYQTNFFKGENGNSIRSGDTLTITLEDVDHASGAIYENGLPIQADFDDDRDGTVVLSFRLLEYQHINGVRRIVGLEPGTYVLKVRGYKDGRGGNGIDDEFLII